MTFQRQLLSALLASTVGTAVVTAALTALLVAVHVRQGASGMSPFAQQHLTGLLVNAVLLAVAVGAVLAVTTATVLSRRIAAPLMRLEQTATALAAGSYSQRTVPVGVREIDQAGSALNDMAANLADAEARRRELVSNIAHELRTPLTSLTGYVQGMADGVFPAEPGTLHPMLDELARLTRLVDDMTLLSRAESADMPLRLQRIPVGALVDAAMTVARPLAAERDVTLKSTVAPSLPDLLADPDWCRAVLVNLLNNAITHGRAGGHVNITAAEGASGVTLVVSDDGPGIDQGDLPHVFERFYRADRSRARRGGTGIGLAVVKQVVSRHGGGVSVGRSTAGGAAVAVTLPRWQSLRNTNEAAVPTNKMTMRSSTSHAGSPGGATTLD